MKKQKPKLYPKIYRCEETPTVFEAESFRDRINFFINLNTYLSAIQQTNGIKLTVEEKKNSFNVVALGLSFILAISYTLLLLILLVATNIVFFTAILLAYPIFVIIIGLFYGGNSRKTKHSAEHMVVNFINNYHRLPICMSEIKQSSRIATICGVSQVANLLVWYLISVLVSLFVALLIVISTNDKTFFLAAAPITIILCIVSYFFIKFTKFDQMDKLVLKVSFFLQQHLTTKEATNKDLLLAYTVANYWMRIVYKEFFTIEDLNSNLLKNVDVNIEEIEHLL